MDPDDSETEQAPSPTLKSSILTVAFTACYLYSNQTVQLSHLSKSATKELPVKETRASAPVKKRKTIYLTFDDGPNKGTANVLHIINEEEMPSTFFLVGEHVYGSSLQKAEFDSLLKSKFVEIANHSYTHAFHNHFSRFYQVPDSAARDFIRCADSLGFKNKIIRLPGRNIWRTATVTYTDIPATSRFADSIYQKGFIEMGWDLEWRFNNNLSLINTEDEMLQQIDSAFAQNRTKTKENLVLLAHDQVFADSTDAGMLHHFIQKLKQKDEYDFETVNKYPGLKN